MPQRPCLMLTRPVSDSARFAAQAQAAGWQGAVLIAPLLEIVLLPLDVTTLRSARTLVLTSQHAVRALSLATDARDWVVWAVGPRTAQEARAAGFAVVHQSGGDAKALLDDLTHSPPPAPVVHLRGRHAAADIAAALQAQGQDATAVVSYEQVARPLSEQAQARLRQGGDVVLPVFSPRSGRLLADAITEIVPASTRLHLIAISKAAADAVAIIPVATCHIAAHPDARSMCDALASMQQTLEPLRKPR